MMRPKLQGIELLRDKGKVLGLLVVILWACGLLFNFVFELVLPPGKTPEIPGFTFRNVGPCIDFGQELVERFEVGTPQYICADMETDELPVYLELYIFKSESNKQVYVDGITFTSSDIAYYVNPPLPPGKYWARINWARTSLVDFEFEVVEK